MQFKGIITRIAPPIKVNTKKGENWTQTFELTYEQGQYPKKIAFDVFGTDKLNEYRISLNEQLVCHIDFDVAEVNGRLFNRVRCWKVEKVQNTSPQQGNPSVGVEYPPEIPPATPSVQNEENLPF